MRSDTPIVKAVREATRYPTEFTIPNGWDHNAHGKVSAVTILTEERSYGRATGPSKGYGFLVLPDNIGARAAVVALDRHELRGCLMNV